MGLVDLPPFALRDEGLEILVHDIARIALRPEDASLEPYGAVAQRAHRGGVVAHEQQCPALLEILQVTHALLIEERIANCQRFVDHQYVRIDVRHHREGKPHHHSARIGLHGLVYEVADVGEVQDRLHATADLAALEPQDGRIQHHDLAPGELRIEAATQLQQRRHAPMHLDRARARRQRPRDQLQQR